ncbi:MAG: sigma-54 dependent transcriptional regulator [Acidobacteriota bacterium]
MQSPRHLRLLLVEHDRPVKILLERPFHPSGATAVELRTGDDPSQLGVDATFDVSQLDFELPGVGRIETRRHRRGDVEVEVLLVVGDGQAVGDVGEIGDDAVELLGGLSGDELFLTRPLAAGPMAEIARRARESAGQDTGLDAVRGSILGESSAMVGLLRLVERVAMGNASVLIHGETGTGKTMVARRIHELSPRCEQRFVAINCSAFQDQLLESELFGHERGAFTGAAVAKPGLFEVADGGTLFLDEVGDMSSAMQAKLLQVLDDGQLRRVGGTDLHEVDVRIVSASNKDLRQEVKAGRFREDLLFRLNVIHLEIPSLAERREDIAGLVEHFLERYRLPGKPRKQISPEAIQLLRAYDWPGNVRELANTVEGLTLLAAGDEIHAEDLPPNLRPRTTVQLDSAEAPLPLKEMERLHIERTLRYTDGVKAQAARLLQIDIKTLNSKIKSYDIEL